MWKLSTVGDRHSLIREATDELRQRVRISEYCILGQENYDLATREMLHRPLAGTAMIELRALDSDNFESRPSRKFSRCVCR
jgi:hypothetical protein